MQNMCNGAGNLGVGNEREALYIACEMERRAIRLYERGLMICQAPALSAALSRLHSQEKEHLARFRRMGNISSFEEGDEERLQMLKSHAAQVLFPGGLMQVHREGAFQSVEALLEYAQQGEQTAVDTYRELAKACQREEAKDMFLAIALEEQAHLDALGIQLERLRGAK